MLSTSELMVKAYVSAITGNIKYLHSKVLLKPLTSNFLLLNSYQTLCFKNNMLEGLSEGNYPCFKLGIQSFHFMKAHAVNFSEVLVLGKKICLSFDFNLKNTIKPSVLANLLHCSTILFSLSLTSYLLSHLLIFVCVIVCISCVMPQILCRIILGRIILCINK